jgi:hypothetical protein
MLPGRTRRLLLRSRISTRLIGCSGALTTCSITPAAGLPVIEARRLSKSNWSGEVQAAISLDHGTVPAVSESGDISAKPGQVHPYVHDALRQCEEAKTQLSAAQVSGGHRDKAIQYIDAAIVHLQAAIQEPPCH